MRATARACVEKTPGPIACTSPEVILHFTNREVFVKSGQGALGARDEFIKKSFSEGCARAGGENSGLDKVLLLRTDDVITTVMSLLSVDVRTSFRSEYKEDFSA